MNKMSLEKLCDHFSTENLLLMIGLGFDQRSLVALSHFPHKNTVNIAGVANVGWSDCNQDSIDKFNKITENKGLVLGEKSKSIINVADEIIGFLDENLKLASAVVIDISSLSHELLVVMLGILHRMQILNKTALLYVGASEYSFNSPNDAVWLSRGVRSVRSILGFPGEMLPSRRLHLIILAGFEVERASELIIRCEPTSISIGIGKREQSISESHHEKNKLFFERIDQFIKSNDFDSQEVHHFDFSCVDPLSTKRQILTHIDNLQLNDRNIVICPLNTKLSTVGVVLAALERPAIQVCYAEPEEYNIEGYCKPGNDVSVVFLDKL